MSRNRIKPHEEWVAAVASVLYSISAYFHRDRNPVLMGFSFVAAPDLVRKATGIRVESATGGKDLKERIKRRRS